MKKIFLSLALITSSSFLNFNHVNASTDTTVLYFHDDQNEPLKDFPFNVHSANASKVFHTLDDGYKVVDSSVSSIQINGEDVEIIPGTLNDIEIMDAEDLDSATNDVTSNPTNKAQSTASDIDSHFITLYTVDRSFSNLKDDTVVYLKSKGEIIAEEKSLDGVVTFNNLDANKKYEVSYNKSSETENDLSIEVGEEKYLIDEDNVTPIKSTRLNSKLQNGMNQNSMDQKVDSEQSHSNDKVTIKRAPDDRPPLLQRKKEESTRNTDENKRKNDRLKRNNGDAKPQLPVTKPSANPMKQSNNPTAALLKKDNSSSYNNTRNETSYRNSAVRNDSSSYNNSRNDSDGYSSDSSAVANEGSSSSKPRLGGYSSSHSVNRDDAPSYTSTSTSSDSSSSNTTNTHKEYKSEDDATLPETGEAMSKLLPLAGLMAVIAGISLLYFTRKNKNNDR